MAKFEFYEFIFLWLLEQDQFEFEWDDGNRTKSLEKHQINCEEAESVFTINNNNIKILGIQVSPQYETDKERYGIFGITNTNKYVFLCFTLKENNKIRVISIRETNKKERALYDKLCEE